MGRMGGGGQRYKLNYSDFPFVSEVHRPAIVQPHLKKVGRDTN